MRSVKTLAQIVRVSGVTLLLISGGITTYNLFDDYEQTLALLVGLGTLLSIFSWIVIYSAAIAIFDIHAKIVLVQREP